MYLKIILFHPMFCHIIVCHVIILKYKYDNIIFFVPAVLSCVSYVMLKIYIEWNVQYKFTITVNLRIWVVYAFHFHLRVPSWQLITDFSINLFLLFRMEKYSCEILHNVTRIFCRRVLTKWTHMIEVICIYIHTRRPLFNSYQSKIVQMANKSLFVFLLFASASLSAYADSNTLIPSLSHSLLYLSRVSLTNYFQPLFLQ